jgi:hypothetical protein
MLSCHQLDYGPVCLGCGWLAVQEKLLCRKSCCVEKAAVLSVTVWQVVWLASCMMRICLKCPHCLRTYIIVNFNCISISVIRKYHEYIKNKHVKDKIYT